MICQDVVLDRRNNGFRLQLPAVRNGKTYGDRAFSIGTLKQAVMLYLININTRGQIENRPLQNTRSAGRK